MATFKLSDWRAARQFPQTYPGDRPEQSYLLLNENIHLLFWENKDDITSAYFHQAEGRKRRGTSGKEGGRPCYIDICKIVETLRIANLLHFQPPRYLLANQNAQRYF
jgi:hypothetical protein